MSHRGLGLGNLEIGWFLTREPAWLMVSELSKVPWRRVSHVSIVHVYTVDTRVDSPSTPGSARKVVFTLVDV